MKEVKEIKINVPEGQLISAEVKDGVCTLRIEVAEEMIPKVKESEVASSIREDDDIFVCIKASELRLTDEFMQHRPKSRRARDFKELLEEVIKKGVEDFWRPRMDPTLDEAGNICFKAGEKPAVDKSYKWWCENAKKFNPKRKSRLGTMSQYIAFLGVLIKALVAEGWTVDEAWNAVCNNSQKLGHYCDSEGTKGTCEPTGSRAIVGLCDLANTYKILADDEGVGGFWLAGGLYKRFSYHRPLAVWLHCDDFVGRQFYSVGWLVLNE